MEEKKKTHRFSNINTYTTISRKKEDGKKNHRFFKIKTDTKSVSTLGYLAGKAGLGVLGVFEGVGDLLGGTFAKITGDNDLAEYLYIYDTPVQDLHQKLDEGYDPGKVGRFAGDVATGLGQSSVMLIPKVGQILFFTGVVGNSISSASQKTGKVGGKEYLYGIGSGAMEYALERYISGTGQTLESLTKSGAKNIGSKITKSVGKTAAKNTFGKMVAAQLISSSVGEGAEEFFGNVGDFWWSRITGVDRESKFSWSQAMYDFSVGMASGALMGGVSMTAQNAYANKRGGEISADTAKKDRLLKQVRYMVDKASNMTGGSTAVATGITNLKQQLAIYDNAKDPGSYSANVALGNMELTLMSAEFNVLTDRSAAYIAERANDEIAKHVSTFFGTKITVKDLRDINNPYTRAFAMMDWAGNMVGSLSGTDITVDAEIAHTMESMKKKGDVKEDTATPKDPSETSSRDMNFIITNATDFTGADAWDGENVIYKMSDSEYTVIKKEEDGQYRFTTVKDGKKSIYTASEENARKALARISENLKKSAVKSDSAEDEKTDTEEKKTAESEEKEGDGTIKSEALSRSTTWDGKDITYFATFEGKNGYITIRKQSDGSYLFELFDGKETAESHLETAEEVRAALKEARDFAEGKDGESSTKLSLSEDDKSTKKETAEKEAPKEEKKSETTADEAPDTLPGKSVGSEAEVKQARKLLKGFDLLTAHERAAVIAMMKSGSGIEKATLSSVANLMADRPGLRVLFMKDHKAEASHTVLKNGERLILLDADEKHGKHYRADVIFHEVYHDIKATADIKGLDEYVKNNVPGSYRRKIADRYAKHYNGISISEWLGDRKWTEENYNAYFKENRGISLKDMTEEIAASAMGSVMGSSGFINEYKGNVKLIERVWHGLRKIAKAMANRVVELDGDDSDGFRLAFRDVLSYKNRYEKALLASKYNIAAEKAAAIGKVFDDRDDTDLERARTKFAFRSSKSGMANDTLKPYDEELSHYIIEKGDVIVDKYEKLLEVVSEAFDNPTVQKTAYFGIIDTKTLETIKNSVPNLPKDLRETLFKSGRDYSVAATYDSMRHLVDEKNLSREDVVDYLDRLADTILEFDSVSFDYYTDSYKNKIPGLLFKKSFDDGTLVSFELISNKKRSLALQTLYMESADYKKKKGAETLLMNDILSHTPEARVGQPSHSSIPQTTPNVNTKFSLSEDSEEDTDLIYGKYTPTEWNKLTREEKKQIQDELNRKDAEEKTEKLNASLADEFRRLGVKEERITDFQSIFTDDAERHSFIKGARKNRGVKPETFRVFTKRQVAKTMEALLVNVNEPLVGGKAVLKGKDRRDLILLLLEQANQVKTEDEVTAIAKSFAEELIAQTMYEDLGIEVNAEYEKMQVDGSIENFQKINEYRGKIGARSVKPDLVGKYGKKKGDVVNRRWVNQEGGISASDALFELQNEGILADVNTANEADIIIAINDEYERLKARTEMRRELLPLSAIDYDGYQQLIDKITNSVRDFLTEGGMEIEYGNLERAYQAKAANLERLYQEMREETSEKLKSRWQEKIEKAQTSRDEAWQTAQIIARIQTLKGLVNRDYASSDVLENPLTKNIARPFVKAVNRTKINVPIAKEAAKQIVEWATKQGVKDGQGGIVGDPTTGAMMTQAEYDAFERLAGSGSTEKFTVEELKAFKTAIEVTCRIYNNFDTIKIDGKRMSTDEFAAKAIEDAERAIKEDDSLKGKVKKWLKKAALQFMDPLSVAAHLDGYVYDGVIQKLVYELARAEAEANALAIQLRDPFEKFFADNKKYAKRLAEDMIEIAEGVKITVGQAIGLVEMHKRDQAKAGLRISRIGFHNDNGSVTTIEGYGRETMVKLPNGKEIKLKDAESLIYQWNHDRSAAVRAMESHGFDMTDGKAEQSVEELRAAMESAETVAQDFINQFADKRELMIAEIQKKLTEKDAEFIKITENFFNNTSKELKRKADYENLGYTNVVEGFYYPISRMQSDMAKSIVDGSFYAEFLTMQNLSFNKETIPNANASIEVYNVWKVIENHIDGLSKWNSLYIPVQNINRVWNKNISTRTNVISLKNTIAKRNEIDFNKYMSDLLLDAQKAHRQETQPELSKFIEKVRSNYAVYQLGLNPQTIVKQLLTFPAAMQFVSPISVGKGLLHWKLNADKIDQYSVFAAERKDDKTVVRSFSNTEKISNAMQFTMWGISKMDRAVNIGLFSIAQQQIADENPDAPINSEENLKKAGELTDKLIMLVQDSSDASTKSQAARSSSEALKGTTMFKSSTLKIFSRITENIGRVLTYHDLVKENPGMYEAEYKRAKAQLARSLGAMAGVAVMTALIAQAFKFLFNKDREDKDGNEISVMKDILTDVGSEMIGVIPVIGDAAAYFINGYEVGNFYADTFNDVLKTVGQTYALAEKVVTGEVIEEWEIGNVIRKNARAIGTLTGTPIRNAENFLSGLVRRFSPETGYAYDTLFYNANYTEDVNKALTKGDTKLATAILKLAMKRRKTGESTYSPEALDLIVKLHNEGYAILPKDIDTGGVSRKQYEKIETIYGGADEVLGNLLSSEAFKALEAYANEESSPQANAIKTVYDSYYDLAKYDVLGEELTRKAALISIVDTEKLVLVAAYNKALTMGTAEYTGQKKTALQKYMRDLGMTKEEMAICAYSCGYRTDDVTSLVIKAAEEKSNSKDILTALGLIESEDEEKKATAA